jgi:DNA-damage-inducible protein J
MAQTSLIQVRVDAELKQEADSLLKELGLDASTAIRIFFKQMIAEKSIPFSIGRTQRQRDLKKWKGLTPGMKNPVHVHNFKMYSKEELHER